MNLYVKLMMTNDKDMKQEQYVIETEIKINIQFE